MFESLRYNLKNNRKGVMKNATAWFLFGAIILVFVFWGMTPKSQTGTNTGGAAAIVNDKAISYAQLGEISERMRRDPQYEQMQAMNGDAGRQFLQQRALEQLIQMELIRQATDTQKLWTTDAEVRDVITAIPQFQDQGRFQRDRYLGYLQAVQKSPSEFEDEIRREQSLKRTIELFRAALNPLPMEAAKQKALGDIKADLDFVSVPTESIVAPTSIPATETKTFMADKTNEAKVKDYYAAHASEFSQPEQVVARHILIKSEPGNADSEKAALAKAEDILKRAKTEDFGKLAHEFSDDPGSKDKNGDLGSFARGRMVPEFEKVAFSAEPGKISDPVKTQFGYHLIQVQSKTPAKTRSLEDASESIAQTLLAKERSVAALNELDQALKSGDAVQINKFVDTHHLKWDDTGAFSIKTDNIPKIGPNDEVARVAFSLTPQKPYPSALIRQGPSAFLVKYKAVPPAKADPKAKANEPNEEMMQTFLAGQRSQDALGQWMENLKKSAKISTNDPTVSR